MHIVFNYCIVLVEGWRVEGGLRFIMGEKKIPENSGRKMWVGGCT